MIIAALDFGSAAICNTDYLEVYDAVFNGSGSTASRRLITRYCGNVSAKKGKFKCGDNSRLIRVPLLT